MVAATSRHDLGLPPASAPPGKFGDGLVMVVDELHHVFTPIERHNAAPAR
jgi:hypothetical protein